MKAPKIIILILLITAVGLGIAIYKKNYHPKSVSNSVSLNNNSNKSLTDEQAVLQIPGSSASQEEINKHDALAIKLAVPATELDITDCHAKPVVLLLELENNFNLINSGTKDFKITFEQNNTVSLSPKKSAVIKASSFSHGRGLYGYRCNQTGFDAIAGFIYIVPAQ